jgi:hypothetical protein
MPRCIVALHGCLVASLHYCLPCCAATALRSVLAHNLVWLTNEPFAAAFFERHGVAPHLPPELAGAPTSAGTASARTSAHRCAAGIEHLPGRAAPLRTYGLRRRWDARRPQRAVAAVPLRARRALPAARRRRVAGEVRHSPGGVGNARTCKAATCELATTKRVKLQRVHLQRRNDATHEPATSQRAVQRLDSQQRSTALATWLAPCRQRSLAAARTAA